jgi:hypothetical protein
MEGGLRLDSHEKALLGGTSQETTLGGTLQTNPIYLRVTSSDPEIRMPLADKPLPTSEVETIAHWVEQGTPWPASTIPIPPSPSTQPALAHEPGLLGSLAELWDEIEKAYSTYEYLKRLSTVAIACLLLALFVEICREARKKEKPWTRGKLRYFVSFVCLARLSYFVVAVLSIALFFVWRDFHGKVESLRVERDNFRLNLAAVNAGVPSTGTTYGTPPKPNRPNKPKEISGDYYRGNCERNPKLFNGGNYRTATFHLAVADVDHHDIKLDEPIKDGAVSIRFEIERAPKTADEFFSRKTTDRIFLAENHASYPAKNPTSSPVCLQAIEPGHRWGGFYRICDVPGDKKKTKKSGLIYVVVGILKDDAVVGQIHYGIQYDLIFEDHKIVTGSDVWMSELYITPPIARPQPDKIPLAEWFDWKPIPEITGENTKDPKLLGIDTLSGGPEDPLSNKK